MGVIVDIIVIAIIALSVFLGYRKGLIALAIQLCAVIIALVATLVLYKPISALIIDNTSLDENIQNAIIEKAQNNNENNSQENTTQNTTQNNELANRDNIDGTEESNIINIMPEVAKQISINIINIGVMLILYFGIKIALHFVTALANIVAKIPIIKQLNKLGGVIYGLLRGILLIYVVLLLISFAGQINPENTLHKQINESFITKEMYGSDKPYRSKSEQFSSISSVAENVHKLLSVC